MTKKDTIKKTIMTIKDKHSGVPLLPSDCEEKKISAKRTAVRGTAVSIFIVRAHLRPPETPRIITALYRIEGFKGGP